MRRLLRWTAALLALGLAVSLALAAWAVALALQPAAGAPSAPWPAEVRPEHIERAVTLFLQHDPRGMPPGSRDSLQIAPADADLALNYFARRFAHTSTRLTLGDGTARLQAVARLPANRLSDHLEAEIVLREEAGQPRITQLRIGHLEVPVWLADVAHGAGLAWLRDSSAGAARALDSLQQLELRPDGLAIAYVWRGKLPGAGGLGLWSAAEQARIDAYTAVLVQAADAPGAGGATLPLQVLVAPVFQAAAQRSAAEGTSAVAENRAALVALAQFVNAEAMAALFTGAAPLAATTRSITLNGRVDTAQHFTVSAALAATAGAPVADAVGLYKELHDAQGGSGFSFNDLAADRAGTRLADRATAGEDAARRQQQALAVAAPAPVLLPVVDDLPENMQLAEFTRRFGGIDAPAALRLRADIERRLGALPVYR